jgi:hypothetical protein
MKELINQPKYKWHYPNREKEQENLIKNLEREIIICKFNIRIEKDRMKELMFELKCVRKNLK